MALIVAGHGAIDPWAPALASPADASPVWVFLDESNFDYGATSLTATAAIVIAHDDRDRLESNMAALHREIRLGENFWYDENPERRAVFARGFHATTSNVRINDEVRNRIRSLPFRIYIAHSRRSDSRLVPRYASLYVSIITKLLRRYKGSPMAFVFEQHEELAPHFKTIVTMARDRARDPRTVLSATDSLTVEAALAERNQLVVAQAGKTVPGCAIADAVLYDFGTAVKAGLLAPGERKLGTAYQVRYWTHELAPRVAYEYDFDRDDHVGRRFRRRRVESH
jgi:hypothetical protein